MAADIERQTGVRPTLIKGGKGVFDVKVDGKLIFSKYDTHRFPEHREVLDQLPTKASQPRAS